MHYYNNLFPIIFYEIFTMALKYMYKNIHFVCCLIALLQMIRYIISDDWYFHIYKEFSIQGHV